MAISYDDYMKARSQKSTASNPKPSTNATSSSNSNQSSKLTYEDYMNRVNANKESGANGSFKWRNNTYIVDKTTGQTTKVNPFIKQKSKERKKKDEESLAKTGHESFITDIGEALSGGMESWGASQLSTGATLGLAYNALRNKDNNYTPEFGSELWKLTHAASGGANYANKLMEGSKEGRGKVGQIVMDVGSQAVMNGIDAAIRSIPGIGQALGTASFMSRSFGGTAQQKRDEGKGIATQVLSGAISAGIEQFTEGMSRIGGIRSYTGADTGWLDGAYTMLESSVAKKLGPVVAKLSTTMLSEGIEEVMSDILSPLVTGALENVTKDSKLLGDFEAEQWQSVGDIAYDGLIGALSAIGGGMVEATGAMNTYRNEANSDNALYSTMLRQQYEVDRAEAKRGKALQLGSLFDAVNTLFNKETGESLTERASKAAGTFVRNKDVGKVLAQTDADYVRVVNEVAEKFADQSFANEAVDKDVLKQGVINFFLNGDFSEDLNSIEGAKGQLKKLAQEIMKADAESRLAKAKSTKNKTKEAYYSSLLANLVNRSFAEESTNANVDDITEARTYGYSAEELAADQAAREAERQRMESKGTYDEGTDVPFFTGEDTFQQEQVQETEPAAEAAPEADAESANRKLFDEKLQEINNRDAEARRRYEETINEYGGEIDSGYMGAIEKHPVTMARTALAHLEVKRQTIARSIAKELDNAIQSGTDTIVLGSKDSSATEVGEVIALRFNALEAEANKRGYSAEPYWNNQTNQWEAKISRNALSSEAENGTIETEQASETVDVGDILNEKQTVQYGEEQSAESENSGKEQASTEENNSGLSDEAPEVSNVGEETGWKSEYDRIVNEANTNGSFIIEDTEYSFINPSGKRVGRLVTDEARLNKLNKYAAQKLIGSLAHNEIKFLWFDGNIHCSDLLGGIGSDSEFDSGGVTLRLENGEIICICGTDTAVAVHESVHGIQFYLINKFGDINTEAFIKESVTAALGETRREAFFRELKKDIVYENDNELSLYWETFAYLSNGDSFFTDNEINSFLSKITDKNWQKQKLGSKVDVFDRVAKTAKNYISQGYGDIKKLKYRHSEKANQFLDDFEDIYFADRKIKPLNREIMALKSAIKSRDAVMFFDNDDSGMVYLTYKNKPCAYFFDVKGQFADINSVFILNDQRKLDNYLREKGIEGVADGQNGTADTDADENGDRQERRRSYFSSARHGSESSTASGISGSESTNEDSRNNNENSRDFSSGVRGAVQLGEEAPTLDEFRKARGETKRENLYEQREGQDEAARQAERLAMDDAEYNELRQADKAIPTIQEFERGEDQPVAPKKASPSEANEIAERSFGKKGRVRATRVVENFKNRINANLDSLTDAQKSHLEESMGKLSKALEDINDGYGTVKDLADTYRAWRDDKLLADYYDEDIAARFDKILEDAEAKGWTFEAQDQREFAQAYEEACNAMTAKINNVNKSADRLSRLKIEAIANKLNIKSDGLISKTIQRFIRMQITTDTAMKLFGGFKGSGEFYQLGKDIKDSVAKRMVKYVDAYSHFDNLKKMEGFKEFSQNTKKYQLEFNNEFNDKGVGLDNPFKGVDLSLQQIVTISRLIKTLDKTFEHSDAKAADRVKGFVIRDSNGNSKTIDLGLGDTTDTGEAVRASGKMTAIKLACDRILNQDGAVFEVARAYDKACDAMFKSMGKDVSAVKKALTGNALSLIGEDYTPVLWANDDGSPAEFNFNDDDRLRPPAFLYNRTAKQGNLVVSDISYIVDKYIEKAADYIGTAEIKDTLARLNDGTSLLDKGKGLNSSLAENFGKDAGTWFDEYVKDLTQYGENDSIWAALRRNMQKGALIGSPSVMMKQTSSYWSAMGLLSPEALAMAYRWKVGVKAADNSEYNKLLKYRHISDNIDPTLTEIIKGVDKYGKASNSRVFQLFTNGISEQDFKTVDNLYTATMIDTYLKNQNKGAEYFSSGEFQNDIDSKFTEVMMRSQPMFDTELRAEYARTDNELVKMTSMFRTQQTQNLNLIATAIGEYNASKGTGEQGEKLKVLQQTVAGQASAALSLALLSVAADFMLHGLKKYRGDGDDDDEEPGDGKIELGRILGRIGLNTVETGAGTVWFGDSVAKWLIDRMSGGETSEFYGLNMGPITTFKNVLDNLEYVAKSPTPSNIKNVATNISQLMGIPLNNAYRIVNSAVMYVEDVAGVNDKNYDDMLKQVTNRTKVNEKNVAGRNLLVESGMTKREATAFVKTVDVDDNGLNKEDLQNYYIEHPEDAERVSILWDSMGWKTKFEKEQKSLDKKVVYNSNPLYAEMDEDESGSVTKTEMMDYALEHEDQMDELSALYKEQGFKGSFRSALKSAENSKLKEQAEDAFYDGDYNVLFDTVSQMKNGKTYLTNLIKDEYDEYDNVSNPLVRYMIDAKRPVKEIDEAVEAYGAKKFIPQYKALRATGLAPKAAIQKLDNFDANANGSITQQELADYYKAHKDEEAMIAEFWKACGWSTTWSKYKKRKKLK